MRKQYILFALPLVFMSCNPGTDSPGTDDIVIDTIAIEIGNAGLTNYNSPALAVYTRNGSNYMVCYNYFAHELDYYNLDSTRYLRSLKLSSSGPNAIRTFSFLACDPHRIFAESATDFTILDHTGNVFGKILTPNWFESDGVKYRLATNMYVGNYDTGFSIDSANQRIIFQIYPLMKKSSGDYFKGYALASCTFDSLKPVALQATYPEYLQRLDRFDEMDRPQIMVKGDSVIFSFASHPDIYIYSLKNSLQTTKKIASKKYPPITPSNNGKFSPQDLLGYFDKVGNYLPVKYDRFNQVYYRIYIPPKSESSPDSSDNRRLLVINENFKVIKDIPIPKGLETYYFPTRSGLLFQFETYYRDDHTLSLALMRIKDLH
jgi:hypothetical protein